MTGSENTTKLYDVLASEPNAADPKYKDAGSTGIDRAKFDKDYKEFK